MIRIGLFGNSAAIAPHDTIKDAAASETARNHFMKHSRMISRLVDREPWGDRRESQVHAYRIRFAMTGRRPASRPGLLVTGCARRLNRHACETMFPKRSRRDVTQL